MGKIATAIILLVIGIGALIISIRSFQEKGFLFNNAYLYASKQERENMDKKPHYRQTAVVFLLAGIALLLGAGGVFLDSGRIFYAVVGILVVTMVYAVVSGIRMETKKRHG